MRDAITVSLGSILGHTRNTGVPRTLVEIVARGFSDVVGSPDDGGMVLGTHTVIIPRHLAAALWVSTVTVVAHATDRAILHAWKSRCYSACRIHVLAPTRAHRAVVSPEAISLVGVDIPAPRVRPPTDAERVVYALGRDL